MIKRIVFLLLVMFSNYAYGLDDVAGWKNTKWGMTYKEALELFPEAAERYTKDGAKYLAIKDISVSDIFMDGTIDFDKNNKIHRVVLSLPITTNNESSHLKLKQLLTEKYGQPTFNDTKYMSRGSYNSKTVWKFATTTIELDYNVMKNLNVYILILLYTPTREEANL